MSIEEEIEGLFAQISEAKKAGRSAFDRFRDFRAVFLDTPEGKRVMYDIMEMGHVYKSSMRDSPHQTVFREGERNLALKIMITTHCEPKQPPDRQQSRKGES